MNKPNLSGISVLVDGGCLNNNKPVSERSMYGSMTVFNGERQIDSRYAVDANGTMKDTLTAQRIHRFDIGAQQDWASNNVAEVAMIRTALRYAWQVLYRMDQLNMKTPGGMTVLSDSEWALGVVTGQYKLKAANQVVFNNWLEDIKWYKSELEKKGCPIIFQHVDNVWVKTILGH